MPGTVGAGRPFNPFEFNDPALSPSSHPQIFSSWDTGSGQFVLQDPSGALWLVSIADTGLLQTTLVVTGAPIVLLLDDPAFATSWLLGVNTSGQLTTTAENFSLAYPSVRWMGSTSKTWGLRVLSNGLLITQPSPTIFENSCVGCMTIVNYGNSYTASW